MSTVVVIEKQLFCFVQKETQKSDESACVAKLTVRELELKFLAVAKVFYRHF